MSALNLLSGVRQVTPDRGLFASRDGKRWVEVHLFGGGDAVGVPCDDSIFAPLTYNQIFMIEIAFCVVPVLYMVSVAEIVFLVIPVPEIAFLVMPVAEIAFLVVPVVEIAFFGAVFIQGGGLRIQKRTP